jgi:hypothetical protein
LVVVSSIFLQVVSQVAVKVVFAMVTLLVGVIAMKFVVAIVTMPVTMVVVGIAAAVMAVGMRAPTKMLDPVAIVSDVHFQIICIDVHERKETVRGK